MVRVGERMTGGWMRAAVGVAAVLVLGVAGPAAAEDRVIATVARPTDVDAYRGRAVWSAWDPARHAYRLTAYVRGRVEALPLAPGEVPFDVDLGPGPHGLLHAVFSRCKRPPLSTWALDGRRGCDLYAAHLGAGQFKLRHVNSAADEYWPTIWNGQIAFTRTYRPRGGAARRYVYRRALDGGDSPHRLRRGSTKDGDAVPEQLDMRGGRVTFVWRHEFGAELRVASGRGGRLLVRVPGSGAAAEQLVAQGPSLRGGAVYWALSSTGSTPEFGEIRRVDIADRRQERATPRIDAPSEGFAQDGGVSWYVRAAGPGAYEIHRATGLEYQPAPPIVLH
jgi:hypothetical protein